MIYLFILENPYICNQEYWIFYNYFKEFNLLPTGLIYTFIE